MIPYLGLVAAALSVLLSGIKLNNLDDRLSTMHLNGQHSLKKRREKYCIVYYSSMILYAILTFIIFY